jgi:hypothetical protein
MFEHSLRGHFGMAILAVRHVAFSMGWPLLIAAAFGIALATGERNRVLLSLLIFPASYYLFFIVPILYHRVRYFLPFCIVLSFFAARALTWISEHDLGRPRLGRAMVAILMVYTFLRPVSFLQEMLFDSRYTVEAWLSERSADDKVMFIGQNRPLLPRGRNVRSLERAATEGAIFLRRTEPDFVVVNENEGTTTRKREFLEALVGGELDFRVLFRSQYEPWPFRLDRDGLATNLVTVNPPLTVLEREDPVGDASTPGTP